jgi:hypothetical protein
MWKMTTIHVDLTILVSGPFLVGDFSVFEVRTSILRTKEDENESPGYDDADQNTLYPG